MDEAYITPKKTYFFVYLALLVLLGATVAVYYFNLGALNLIIALTIAIAKAVLVILYFMHIRYSSRLTQFFALMGFVWLAILVGLTVTDYLTR